MDSSADKKAKVSGDLSKTPPESSLQSTVSTVANSTDSLDCTPVHIPQKVEKRARFEETDDYATRSRKEGSQLRSPSHKKTAFSETTNTHNLGKFSCCSIVHPTDPVKDPISLLQTDGLDGVPLNRNPRPHSSGKEPSNFVFLDRYGYYLKNTGPLLKLNISGTAFVIKVSTLQRDQIVFDKFLEDAEYLAETEEYYFERDPVVFRFVHAYLRNQEMHLPLNICGPMLEKELEAWGIQLGLDLQRCCLGPVMETKSKMESLRSFEETFSETPADWHFQPHKSIRWQKLRQYVWRIITDTPKKRWLGLLLNGKSTVEEENTSPDTEEEHYSHDDIIECETTIPNGTHNVDIGTVNTENITNIVENGDADNVSQISENFTNHPFNWRTLQKTPRELIFSRAYVATQFLIVLSLILYMTLAYVPSLREPFGPFLNITHNSSSIDSTFGSFPVYRSYYEFNNKTSQVTRPVMFLRVLTWICVVLFTIDLIARGIFCPRFWRWLRSIYTITDILSLVPFYVEGIILAYVDGLKPSTATESAVRVLFIAIDISNLFKVFVVSRVFRLLQRQRATRVLMYTIRTAAKNISMVFELMLLCAIFFGTALFFFDSNITTIFTGIWWAFTTMTTVGYGDITPSTIPGKLIAILCMIFGILLTSYTIPVLVNDFLLFYGHADQLAWMRRVHKTATVKRSKEKRDLMTKRRISQVRALIRHAVIGMGTIHGEGHGKKTGAVNDDNQLASSTHK